MRIYVAASSKEMERAEAMMKALRERGHEITFDWTVPIRERAARGESDRGLSVEQRGFFAYADAKGIVDAEVFWQLIPTTPSSGAWWELGYATGLRDAGAKHPHIVISGDPERCLFTALIPFAFATDDQALAYIFSATNAATISEIERRMDERAAQVKAYLAAYDGCSIRMESRIGWTLLVSRCPSEPGKWRITRFDGEDPVGHTTLETWARAIAVAVDDYGGELARSTVVAAAS